jgi:hypothetical protein
MSRGQLLVTGIFRVAVAITGGEAASFLVLLAAVERRARLLPAFEFAHERGHRGVQGDGKFADDLDRRHSLSAFEHGNIGPVKARLVGEGFLGQTSGLPPAADKVAEFLLQGCVHFLASEQHLGISSHRQLYVRQLYSTAASGKLPGQPSRQESLKPRRGAAP